MQNLRIASLALALIVLGVGACNTVDGVGEDVEQGGENLSGAAGEAEREIEN